MTVAMVMPLVVGEKKTVGLDLYQPLRDYIVIDKSLAITKAMEQYLNNIKQMRNDVEQGSSATLEARRDLLQKYYRALCIMESTFLISLGFTWYDSFKKNQQATEHNIYLEKAAIIFNLGAIHSQIALSSRSVKEASIAFQAAAGAFAFLRNNISVKASKGQSTLDVSVECAYMLERLMLAQAQECLFCNFVSNGYPSSLCSEVARQISLYYHQASVALDLPPLNSYFDIKWIAHVHLKDALFYAEASYRFSVHLHEKQEIAEEIARLKDGLATLAAARNWGNVVSLAPLAQAASKLEGNINLNLKRATEENERIYLQTVPEIDTLPPLAITSFVKSTPLDESLAVTDELLLDHLQHWLRPDFSQALVRNDPEEDQNCSIQ